VDFALQPKRAGQDRAAQTDGQRPGDCDGDQFQEDFLAIVISLTSSLPGRK
jgi:hypothetical protein